MILGGGKGEGGNHTSKDAPFLPQLMPSPMDSQQPQVGMEQTLSPDFLHGEVRPYV